MLISIGRRRFASTFYVSKMLFILSIFACFVYGRTDCWLAALKLSTFLLLRYSNVFHFVVAFFIAFDRLVFNQN